MNAIRNYKNYSSPVLNINIADVSIGVIPIESQECNSFECYLNQKISTGLYAHDYIQFQVTSFSKGWFCS